MGHVEDQPLPIFTGMLTQSFSEDNLTNRVHLCKCTSMPAHCNNSVVAGSVLDMKLEMVVRHMNNRVGLDTLLVDVQGTS